MFPDLRAHLHATLDAAPVPEPAPGDRLAAVLALLIEEEETVVLTERSAELRRHAGEIAFPGGLAEPGDASLAATALREAYEEIGLDPSLPEILGALPPIHTFVSGILVTPFVGLVERRPEMAPRDGEVVRVLATPIARLLEVERTVTWERPGGRRWTGWVYDVDGSTVWGATGWILHDLLEALRVRA